MTSKVVVRCVKCGTTNDEDAEFCKRCSVRLRPDVAKSSETPSVGLLVVWFIAGFFLSIIGVILSLIVAGCRKDNVGMAALYSICGMIAWLILWAILISA